MIGARERAPITGLAAADCGIGQMPRRARVLVVANDVSRDVFSAESDEVAFVSADGVEALPRLPKAEVARRLVERLAERLG